MSVRYSVKKTEIYHFRFYLNRHVLIFFYRSKYWVGKCLKLMLILMKMGECCWRLFLNFLLFCVVSCNCCYFYLSLQHYDYVYVDGVLKFGYVFWNFNILYFVSTLLVISKILMIKCVLNTLYLLLIFVMKLGWTNCWKKLLHSWGPIG